MSENITVETVANPAAEETARESTHEAERYVAPAVDIVESSHGLTVVADLPGLSQEDIHVSTEQNVLTIKGVRRESAEREFVHREFHPVGYYRQFTLGNKVDQKKIRAEYRHGVLRLELPFAEELKPRQIAVKVA